MKRAVLGIVTVVLAIGLCPVSAHSIVCRPVGAPTSSRLRPLPIERARAVETDKVSRLKVGAPADRDATRRRRWDPTFLASMNSSVKGDSIRFELVAWEV